MRASDLQLSSIQGLNELVGHKAKVLCYFACLWFKLTVGEIVSQIFRAGSGPWMVLWQKMYFMGVDQVVKWSRKFVKEDMTVVRQTGLQGHGPSSWPPR